MAERPSLLRTALPLLLLEFALVGWFTPPDPFSQLVWSGVGLVVVAAATLWFARDSARRLRCRHVRVAGVR